MNELAERALHGQGRFCSIMVLNQDGPLSNEVCNITMKLLKLADKCWDAVLLDSVRENVSRHLPRSLTAARIGTELHYRMFKLVKNAKRQGEFPANLELAATVGKSLDADDAAEEGKGKRTKGPDFVLKGSSSDPNLVAAWELTTNTELPSHYDRDILGKEKGRAQRDYSAEAGVREPEDKSNYWSSYIAICY